MADTEGESRDVERNKIRQRREKQGEGQGEEGHFREQKGAEAKMAERPLLTQLIRRGGLQGGAKGD